MKFKVNKTKDYTVISNTHLRDKRLSLKSKGLLTMMLSLPDNWDYSINGLVAICKEGKDGVRTALDELKANGYLIISKERESSGRYTYIYNIYEKPDTGKPYLAKPSTEVPDMEKPATENPTQLNTDKLNTKELNTDKSNKERCADALGISAPEKGDLQRALDAFVSHRKGMKKPLSADALELIRKRLDELAATDAEKVAILNQSIRSGWKDVFPLKKDNTGKPDAGKKYPYGNTRFQNYKPANYDFDEIERLEREQRMAQ